MQLNELKSTTENKSRRRIGRGGKRGTFSGRGSKGQKSRAGHRIRPGFRGGDQPLWKIFPKRRGATKKVEVKHRTFSVTREKPAPISLSIIEKNFESGDVVTLDVLKSKFLVNKNSSFAKILSNGELKKKVTFKGFKFSKEALKKIEASESKIEDSLNVVTSENTEPSSEKKTEKKPKTVKVKKIKNK